VGTQQINAKVAVWNLTSREYLSSITLVGSAAILALKFSADSTRIICTALMADYFQAVFLLSVNRKIILGCCSFTYSLPFRIKDIEFEPSSNEVFFTCGIQHMSYWQDRGGILVFEELPMKFYRDQNEGLRGEEPFSTNYGNRDIEIMEKDQLVKVSFLSMIFILDCLITAADDGMVEAPLK
jgi:hypothetical protein